MTRWLLAAAIALFAAPAFAQKSGVMGTWLTASGAAQVRLSPCIGEATGALCGVVVALFNPKGPDGQVVTPQTATDHRNENAALRSRKVLGMLLIWGFKATSDPNEFEGGRIYNAENGKTYSANISLQPDGKLRLRGYVGSPMLGETQLWTRVSQ